jgi:glycogen debranching enzyme
VHFRGNLLNDPHRPYWGHYTGDEDTRRKPAYHNGTAWTWPFPSYCEAWAMTYGEAGRQTARAWLTSSIRLVETGCLGHLPEVLDGDTPHTSRGCDAQAWGASEWVRVWVKLSEHH